jgi:predicted DNA-binding transcriptional regulator AlpA
MRLLGIGDLAKRWNYTRQGVHKKMQYDQEFPKPVGIINSRVFVFSEEDIKPYEQKRKELTDERQKHWITHGRFKYFLKHQHKC